jgi:hypothetical protein
VGEDKGGWQSSPAKLFGDGMLKLHNVHNGRLTMHSRKSLWVNDLGAESERKSAGEKFCGYAA